MTETRDTTSGNPEHLGRQLPRALQRADGPAEVYCSPNLSTARWYARPQILFGEALRDFLSKATQSAASLLAGGDKVYHRVIFELRVNTEKRIRNRQYGSQHVVLLEAERSRMA